jgi:hypothetical protein
LSGKKPRQRCNKRLEMATAPIPLCFASSHNGEFLSSYRSVTQVADPGHRYLTALAPVQRCFDLADNENPSSRLLKKSCHELVIVFQDMCCALLACNPSPSAIFRPPHAARLRLPPGCVVQTCIWRSDASSSARLRIFRVCDRPDEDAASAFVRVASRTNEAQIAARIQFSSIGKPVFTFKMIAAIMAIYLELCSAQQS